MSAAVAVNEIHIDATPERCFDVLSDPRSFSYWVVGASEIKAADPEWPKPGAAFDHAVGVRPFRIHDHTEVERMEENRLLLLRAKGRPLGTAQVLLRLAPDNGGTRLTLEETPGDFVSRLLFMGPLDRLVWLRNAKAIRRLKELAEGKVSIPGGSLPESDGDRDSGKIAP